MLDVGQPWLELCASWGRICNRGADSVAQIGARIWQEGELYSPERHLRELNLYANESAQQALDGFYEWLDGGHAVYEDVEWFFATHLRSPHRFSVASFGEENFQRRKVASLPVSKDCFTHTVITDGPRLKANEMLKRREPDELLILVDDNPGEHEAAALAQAGIVRVQMLRRTCMMPSAHAQYHVQNLREFNHLLTQLHR